MFIPTVVNISEMKIGTPDHRSNVFFGTNFYRGINNTGKKNQGFGQQFGDELITAFPINITFDDDFIDEPIVKINRDIPVP